MAASVDDATEKLRVVLIGKTGAGKSSLGNTLLGKRGTFKVGRGMTSETVDCKWDENRNGNVNIEVTDTPGLCDTHRPEKDVYLEVGKSVALACPGPHVIIMVLRCDKRFTKEEYKAYTALKQLFTDKMCDHMVIVFNGLDSLQGDDEIEIEQLRQELKAEIDKGPEELRNVLEDARQRYFGINNKATKPGEKQQQADELLKLLMDLVTKNGKAFYSTKWCVDIAKRVEDIIKKRVEEEQISREEAEKATKQDIANGKIAKWFYTAVSSIVESAASVAFGVASAAMGAAGTAIRAADTATRAARDICKTM